MNIDNEAYTEKCPHCGQTHPLGAHFCPLTGAHLEPTKINCPHCGQPVEPSWMRCPHCAAQLPSPGKTTTGKKWLWLAAGLLLLLTLGAVGVAWGLSTKEPASEEPPKARAMGVSSPTLDTSKPVLATPSPNPSPNPATTTSPTPALLPTHSPTATIIQLDPTLTNTLIPTLAHSPTATPPLEGPWLPCPGTYLSYLRVDDLAMVSFDPPLPNRVRAEPNTYSTILGKIQPGQQVIIKDGPVCAGNWVWWKVRVVDSSLRGWTAEGDQGNYWLVPVP